MRISALGGACLLVMGLAALCGTLYYDQAHAAAWTYFAPSSNAMNGPAQALTARIFTLLGAVAGGLGALIAAVSALLAATGRTVGRWILRVTAVLMLVVLLLVAVVVIVGAVTGGEPTAVIDTPLWLLIAEWAALILAVLGAGATTARLWRFVPDEPDDAPGEAADYVSDIARGYVSVYAEDEDSAG